MIDAGREAERMRDYLVGRLSDDEQRAFEECLVRDPALARELEQMLRLREGLAQLKAQGFFEKPPARAPLRLGVLSSRLEMPPLRLAVPLLAAATIAGIGLLVWVQTRPSPVLTASIESRAAAPAITAHFTFIALRDASTPQLDLPASGLIEIRAAPGLRTTAAPYRVTLARHEEGASATPIGVLAGLALGADGYVHCYANAAGLKPGGYLLRVASDAQTAGTAEIFRFNLRSRETR
jgi:hypothetical protein